MPRTSTTTRTKTRSTGRISARHKPAAGKPGRRVAAEQQVKPKQPKQAKRHTPIDADDELYEEIDLDDAGPSGLCSSEARRRIEVLREERLLQQALNDTFDF